MNALIIELANQFQALHEGLDANNTREAILHDAILHDAIHMVLGLGVSLPEEELVLNVTNCLQGGETNPKLTDKVTSLISKIPFETLLIITEALA